MKNITIVFILLVLVTLGILTFRGAPQSLRPTPDEQNASSTTSPQSTPAVEVLATDLEIPWDIAFLPDQTLLITERPGRLSHLQKDGTRTLLHDEQVRHRGEGGLLGVVLHPNFEENHFVYLYFTAPGEDGETENRVERYELEGDALRNQKIIIEGIPGAIYHDGGRMEFGPDGLLYITTGDATRPRIAQDKNSLGGKILRLKDDGSIPAGNPFNTAVYSYGHRNPQGITWDSSGNLWSTEHGRSGVRSGLDELNLVTPGSNYGWPDSEGDTVKSNTVGPVLHSGASATWAPASAVYFNGSIFFGGLLGEALYEAVLDGENVDELKKHFYKEFGRIRTVRVGPDEMLYITTSNRDGRGNAREGDDKLIRIDPKQLNK